MQPDLQSFNTLMDVFAKMGDWERAWSVMGAIRRAAVAPDTWSHNTLISACARCVARLSCAVPEFSIRIVTACHLPIIDGAWRCSRTLASASTIRKRDRLETAWLCG